MLELSRKLCKLIALCLSVSALSSVRESATDSARTEFSDCDQGCPKMVVLPAGKYDMGSADEDAKKFPGFSWQWEGPRHRVTIGYRFALSKFNISREEWEVCVRSGGCNGYMPATDRKGIKQLPVFNIRWEDAQAYVLWLSNKTGKTYRLLSEAEWEYAARAGTATPFFTGERFTASQGNFLGSLNPPRYTTVGQYPANAFGLHDMVGNVRQWTQDCLNHSYVGAPGDGAAWTQGNCQHRMVRGASWFDLPAYHRSAHRRSFAANERNTNATIGLRVARLYEGKAE